MAQQAIGVLVRAALPRAMRITEIDGDVGFDGEALVIGQLSAIIPGQRFIKLIGKLARLLDESVDDGLGLPVLDLREHDIARVSFDQRDDEAVLRSAQQIAFPMAKRLAVINILRAFMDRNTANNVSEASIATSTMVSTMPHWLVTT